jgi:tetratricopeptide (TPR) repeat protein
MLVYAYAILSILILLIAFESHVWGPFVLELPALKGRQMIGKLDIKGYEKIIEICKKREKISCVKSTYKEMYVQHREIEALAELAQFEFQLHETDAALTNFKTYFLQGGKNPKVFLQYGLALEQGSDFDQAKKYFKLSIDNNPEKLSSQATQELIRIAVQQEKFEEAQSLIHHFWASAENAKGYFNREASQIQKVLGSRKLTQRSVASTKKI